MPQAAFIVIRKILETMLEQDADPEADVVIVQIITKVRGTGSCRRYGTVWLVLFESWMSLCVVDRLHRFSSWL